MAGALVASSANYEDADDQADGEEGEENCLLVVVSAPVPVCILSPLYVVCALFIPQELFAH